MADNVTVDNGDLTDFTVSADEAASGKVQRVKLVDSSDGGDSHIPASASTGLLVNTGSNAVTLGGSLPAGTNAIGKLAANSGVDIGDVDVTSIAAGTNYIGKLRLTDGTTDADIIDSGTYAGPGVYQLDGGGDPLTYSPQAVINSGTITGNTSAYAVGDAYHSGTITFAALVEANGKTGHILGATLFDTDGTETWTARLHLFRSDLATGPTLNAEFVPDATDLVKAVGYIDFATFVPGRPSTAGPRYAMGDLSRPIPFPTGGSVDDLYGVLEILTGTPTFSGNTVLTIDLMVQPD